MQAGARMLLLVVVDAVIFTASYVFAEFLRFTLTSPSPVAIDATGLAVVAGVQLLAGVLFRFYRGSWRYVAIGDAIRLAGGVGAALLALLLLDVTVLQIPAAVLVMDSAFAVLLLFGARVSVRRFHTHHGPRATPPDEKRALIIGAGDAAEALLRDIQLHPELGVDVVALVDDRKNKWRSRIRGVEVRGPIDDVDRVARMTSATDAFIALPELSGKRIREIIDRLMAANLRYQIIPGVDKIVSGAVQISELRPVNLEDLFRRERITLPRESLKDLFAGRSVMVTGAGGSIGGEIVRQLLRLRPRTLIVVDRSEQALYELERRLGLAGDSVRIVRELCDVADPTVSDALLRREMPEFVIHAAAHKHVPLGEENPAEYVRNNCLSTIRLAEACERTGVSRFVFISTDKAINPTSVMGASKRAAEIALLDFAQRASMGISIVRFGNVIGSSGSVVPLFMDQIAAGGPVTVTHPEATRYFLRASEAVSLVLQSVHVGGRGQICMLDMGDPVRIVDLARDLIRLSGHRVDQIDILYTGLRPGEKLAEETRQAGGITLPTIHPQILITRPPQPDPSTVRQSLAELKEVAVCGDRASVVRALSVLVSEYQPTDRSGWMRAEPDLLAVPVRTGTR